MRFSRAQLVFCMAALVVLSGCETSTEKAEVPASINSSPIGNFFRTAASSSQDNLDYRSAAKYYQNLYNRDPDDMRALLGLVRNLRYVGSARQAVGLLEDALQDHSGILSLQVEYGKSLVATGQGQRAIDLLSELLEEIPGDWEVLSALGIAYDLIKQPQDAERSYRAALVVAPQNNSVINNLALSLALSGKIDEGIALLEDTVNNLAATPHMRQNLALMYAMNGDIDAAQRLAEQDLPDEMVANNIKYYRRYFSNNRKVARSPTVEVSRLEAPAETIVAPVILTPSATPTGQSQATKTVTAVEDGIATDQPIEGIKIQLGVFKTFDQAAAGLLEMRDGNVDLLSGLRFMIDALDGIDAPLGYMVLAGPLASNQLAADLCTKLHSRKEICRLVLP